MISQSSFSDLGSSGTKRMSAPKPFPSQSQHTRVPHPVLFSCHSSLRMFRLSCVVAVVTAKILVVRQVLLAVLFSVFAGEILFGVLLSVFVGQILLAVLFAVVVRQILLAVLF